MIVHFYSTSFSTLKVSIDGAPNPSTKGQVIAEISRSMWKVGEEEVAEEGEEEEWGICLLVVYITVNNCYGDGELSEI